MTCLFVEEENESLLTRFVLGPNTKNIDYIVKRLEENANETTLAIEVHGFGVRVNYVSDWKVTWNGKNIFHILTLTLHMQILLTIMFLITYK
jgi:hypothetical protein